MTNKIHYQDVDLAYYRAIDLLKQMISTPSFSRAEELVADLLEEWLRAEGIEPIRKGNNLLLFPAHFDPDKPVILLNSHIDTVRPTPSWTRNPFEAVEEEERLYGLGSNDAGASVVSLLLTWLCLKETEQSFNLIFVASAEEEVSGKNGIESILPELPPIHFAIVGEPTGMAPAIAEKGLMVIDGTVYGKSGHAARNEGINAIYEALPVMERLRDFHFEKESPLLGNVKVSLTQVNAGTQHNVIPDKCTFVLDVRTNECYSNEEAFSILSRVAECELKARSFRLNSSALNDKHPFVTRAVMLGKKPFGSPTLSDQALLPFPSVKIGPGDSARSHTADEYICQNEIREAITLYIKLLDGLNL
ncbi:MAG: M20 family metallo-hydrolase [Bacteroidales bacterium]